MMFYAFEQNNVLLIQQRFFFNQKNIDVIEFYQLFQFKISKNFHESIDIVCNKNNFDEKID